MTAIAALAHEGKVWIGGDSAGSSGMSITPRNDSKVFVNGPFVMGFTDSFRMGQLLRWSFLPPPHPEGINDERFMSTTFVDAVKTALREGGWSKKENEVESGGTFIVGYHGIVWTAYSDYQMAQTFMGFDAVGSASDLCLGSLHTTAFMDMEPSLRLTAALEAAERFNGGVCAPFRILCEP